MAGDMVTGLSTGKAVGGGLFRSAAYCALQRVMMMQRSIDSRMNRACNDALHKYIQSMEMNPHRQKAIRDIIRDRMVQSGVDNYRFVDDQLQIGSARYAVDACGCGEPECDGLRLRPVHGSHNPLPGGGEARA